LYFACLGAAFMFLEIAFMQQFIQFLAYPVYAVAVVLVAFLVFSGLGSLFAESRRRSPMGLVASSTVVIAVTAVILLALLPHAFAYGAAWPDGIKILLTLVLLAPLAFCMGMPFPTGMQVVAKRCPALTPWAWGVNGCASTVGATLATLLAMYVGFRWVILSAVALYLVVVAAFTRLAPREGA